MSSASPAPSWSGPNAAWIRNRAASRAQGSGEASSIVVLTELGPPTEYPAPFAAVTMIVRVPPSTAVLTGLSSIQVSRAPSGNVTVFDTLVV